MSTKTLTSGRRRTLLLAAALLAGLCSLPAAAKDRPAPAEPQPRRGAPPRLAVLDFQIGAPSAWWDRSVNVGRGVAELLAAGLVTDGSFSVVERRDLDAALQEQEFGASGRVQPATAARLGEVLGAEYLLTGTVTRFDVSESRGGGSVGGIGIGGLRLGGGRSRTRATVMVNARVVHAATGRVVATAAGKGESSRTGTQVLGSFRGLAGGGLDFGSGAFAETILGEALNKCVAELSKQLADTCRRLPPAAVSARIAHVEGGMVVLNAGSAHGLRVGDVLQVERTLQVIRDPETGEPLRELKAAVGTLRVTEADDRSAIAVFTGTGAPQVGDRATRS